MDIPVDIVYRHDDMKKSISKLSLSLESVRILSAPQLRLAGGAQAIETWLIECYTTGCTWTDFEGGCMPSYQDTCYSVNAQC